MHHIKHTNEHLRKTEKEFAFLSSDSGTYSYHDLNRFTAGFKALIEQEAGSATNIKAVFIADSSDILVLAIAACWQLGIAFIPISPRLPREEVSRYLTLLQPDLLFCSPGSTYNFKNRKSIGLDASLLGRLLADRPELPEESGFGQLAPESTAGYFFTSGSTGEPKIVPVKRRQLLSAARSSSYNFQPDRNHFWILCLPLNHTGGITVILRSLIYGSAVYRMDGFDESRIKEFMSRDKRFQVISIVPTMLYRLLADRKFKTRRRFKAILTGGGPVSKEVLQESITRGLPVISSYGMTETCGQIVANPVGLPSGVYTALQSAGRIFHPNKIQIRNESGRPIGKNQSGIIWLKGPQVFDGYLDEKHNENRFDKDGWFNTGDLGRLSLFGALFIETRREDLIITGGENVNPQQVEQELLKLDGIKEAVVLGKSDPEWGQKVIAFLTVHNGASINSETLKEELKPVLQPFMIPKELHIVPEIPRTDLGKVRRSELLKMLS